MAGRPSKPVQLIKLEGNKDRRTKAELEFREKMEKSLYTGVNFKESPAVKADPIAHKEFLRLKKLYKNIQFVDALDEQVINRYCLLVSEEAELKKMMDKTESIEEKMELDSKLHRKREMLLKYEDRMLLNPATRIKSIPKQPPDDKKQSPMADFLKRRGSHG